MTKAKTAEPLVDPSVEFEGYDVTRFTLKVNAKELAIDNPMAYGDYVEAVVRGRVGKITHEPAADGTLARMHSVSLASVKVLSTSRTVDPNQAGLFGEAPFGDEDGDPWPHIEDPENA